MTIKYREHRGALQESLDTAREFSTLKDCLQYVKSTWENNAVPLEFRHIIIAYYCYDERVKQELYSVKIKTKSECYLIGFIYEEIE